MSAANHARLANTINVASDRNVGFAMVSITPAMM
jgi:hypothetical protein